MNAAFIATSAAPATGPPGGAAAGEAAGAEGSLGAALFSAALGAAVGRRGTDAAAGDGGGADPEADQEPADEAAPAAADVPVPMVAAPVAAPVPAAPWWLGAAFAAAPDEAAMPDAVSGTPAEAAPAASVAVEAGPADGEVAPVLPNPTGPAPQAWAEAAAGDAEPAVPAPAPARELGATAGATEVRPATAPDPAVKTAVAPPALAAPMASDTPAEPVLLDASAPPVSGPPVESAPRVGVPGLTTAVEPGGVRLPMTVPSPAPAPGPMPPPAALGSLAWPGGPQPFAAFAARRNAPSGTGTEPQISLQNLPPVEADAEAAPEPAADATQIVAERPIPTAREWAFTRARSVAPTGDAIREPQAAPRAAALLTAVLGRADATFQAPTPFAVPLPAAPAATSALHATMDAELPSQLIDSIRVLGREGAGEARVRLRPEVLGEVTIAIAVHHGAVTASIEAESPAVRQWVEMNEGLLREKLAEQGLQLERLTVSHEDAPPESGSRERRRSRDEEPEAPARRHRPAGDAPRFEIVL